MTDKIKSCPFCGGEAFEYYSGSQFEFCEVVCKECGCRSKRKSEEEAIALWNTRKPMDRIVEQLEGEIEYCEKQVDKISATSFSIVNGLKRNIYIEKISAYRDAIEKVKEGGKDVTTRNDTGMD